MTRMPRPYRDEIRPVLRQDIKDLERSCYKKAILNNVLQTTPTKRPTSAFPVCFFLLALGVLFLVIA